jgi:hypothetical protein
MAIDCTNGGADCVNGRWFDNPRTLEFAFLCEARDGGGPLECDGEMSTRVLDEVTWTYCADEAIEADATQRCEDAGLNLASIYSERENETFHRFALDMNWVEQGVGNAASLWIGLGRNFDNTVFESGFDDGTLNGLSPCNGCAGLGCPVPELNGIRMRGDWNALCVPNARTGVPFRYAFDVVEQGNLKAIGMSSDTAAVYARKIDGRLNLICSSSGEELLAEINPDTFVGRWTVEHRQDVYSFWFDGRYAGEIQCQSPGLQDARPVWHGDSWINTNALIDNIRWYDDGL